MLIPNVLFSSCLYGNNNTEEIHWRKTDGNTMSYIVQNVWGFQMFCDLTKTKKFQLLTLLAIQLLQKEFFEVSTIGLM